MHGATIRLNGRSCACVSQQRSCWRLWWRQRPVPARSPPRAPLARRPLRSVGSRFVHRVTRSTRRHGWYVRFGARIACAKPVRRAELGGSLASWGRAKSCRVAAWAGTSHRRSPTRVREDQRAAFCDRRRPLLRAAPAAARGLGHVRGRSPSAGRWAAFTTGTAANARSAQAISTRATGSLGCSGRALVAIATRIAGILETDTTPGTTGFDVSDRGGGCESRSREAS